MVYMRPVNFFIIIDIVDLIIFACPRAYERNLQKKQQKSLKPFQPV